MPLLLFGSTSSLPSQRMLYREDGSILDRGSIFDHFRLTYMAPDHRKHCVALFWHLPAHKHCVIAWRQDELPKEQKIIVPGLLSAIEALELVRATDGLISNAVPSPIIFRIENLHSAPMVHTE